MNRNRIAFFLMTFFFAWAGPVAAGYFEADKTGTEGGVVIHKAICASCHGYDGAGDYPSFVNEQLTPRLQGRNPGTVSRVMRGGREPSMPGFSEAEVSDTEVNALQYYVDVTLPSVGPTPDPCIPGPPTTNPSPTCAATVTIKDEDPWFVPYTLALPTLPAKVAFINVGQTFHTVTQGDFLLKSVNFTPGQVVADQWNSGLIGRGGRVFHEFATAGTTYYYCDLHPFMQLKVCAGSGVCGPDTIPSPTSVKPLPPAGIGELWVAVEFIDVAGKGADPGATVKAPFPDLPVTFDDAVKDGELQVIDLATYAIRRVPGDPATNIFNHPHYLWARAASGATKNPEMVVNNYLDNYLTMVDANTYTNTVPQFVWGATTSHTTGFFDGTKLFAPVQGSYGIQELTPGRAVGSWKVGNLYLFAARDQYNRIGSMPHGIWAGGPNGTLLQTANSRSNNLTIFDATDFRDVSCSATTEGFPLNAGITAGGTAAANTNIGNPFTVTSSASLNSVRFSNLGTSKAVLVCGETRADIPLPGYAAVQIPPSPDDRFWAISNGPYISFIDRAANFPSGSTCAGTTAFRSTTGGYRICDINTASYGAHGVAWGRRPAGSGWRVYMSGKFVDFVATLDVRYTTTNTTTGPVAVSHLGDIPLLKPSAATCVHRALAGCTDTGATGLTTNPLPPPWR